MSSSENERRRSRGSDKKQKKASAPRHFRDEKAPVKKAPVEEPEAVIEAPASQETPLSPDSEHHSHHSHHSDSEHHSHHSHHSDSEHHSHHSHHSDSEHHSHHSHHSGSEHHSHHSHRSSKEVVSMWDVEGEKGWQETAYVNAKKIEKSDAELDVVRPVEMEDRIKPEKMAESGEPETATDFVPPVETQEEKKPARRSSSREPETAFDYVAPEQTYKQHLKNPQKSTTHTGKTKKASREEVEEAEEGFVFRSLAEGDKLKKKHRRHHHHHHHHSSSSSSGEGTSASADASKSDSGSSRQQKRRRRHHHRLPRWARILIIVLCVLLALVILMIGAYFILKEIGRRDMHTIEDNIAIVLPTNPQTGETTVEVEVVDNGRTIVHNGKTYRINNDVVCVAFIGINNDYVDKTFQSMGDAINLIALDTETGKLSVIAVSRDTMTDVKVYSVEGNYIDNEVMQLSYAYSFDNENVSGGENTASSLSKLFFGLPVDHYFAINLDALITLNDAIGGVEITSTMDFTSPLRDVSAGETVTLHGKEVEIYVRHREHTVEGNNERMKRQQDYIRAFLQQVIPAVKSDLSLVSELYNIIRANSSSNLTLPKIIYLASELTSKLSSTDDIDYLSLKGNSVEGEEHTEFYVDDAGVMETLINVFYKPV